MPKLAIDSARFASKLHTMKLASIQGRRTMRRVVLTRKARFRAALALAGMTADGWAVGNGITPSHLSHVLSGRHRSDTLVEKVEAFTAKHLGDVAA